MNIWDERYCDEKFGLETPASFRYFQRYLQQSFPREIKALHRTIEHESKLESKTKIPKLQTLYDYSMKWHWVERANAYDEYLKDLHFKNKEMEVIDWESEQLKFAKEIAKVEVDTLQKIHKDTDLSEYEKARAEQTTIKAYNCALDAVYRLLHGGVIKQETKNTNHDTINAKVELSATENLLKDIEKKRSEFNESS